MNGFKFLIDTNIVIGLEDHHQVDSALTELTQRCSANGVRLFVDGAVYDDVSRDSDLARRAVTLSKLERFEKLKDIRYPTDAELAKRYGTIKSANDRSDVRLLHCLERNATDFLITRDTLLHKRARRCDLRDRVLLLEEAILWLRQTFEPTSVELPYIVEREAYAVNKTEVLFDGLRADYPGFDHWFEEKCAKQHRKCWVVDVGGVMAGIVIRKEERRNEAICVSPGQKILKLCTFVMRSEFRGEKFGEQLLKQSLWFAQANGFDVVYLTVFANKDSLIQLLRSYGFTQTGRQDNGELVYEKVMRKGVLSPEPHEDILTFDRLVYPRFYDGERVAKYCVPIRGEYHQKLFPEISYIPPLPLFAQAAFKPERAVAARKQDRTPGNTIRKVYLCRAQVKRLKPGDILLFYMSKSKKFALSQTLTTVGVVEAMRECRNVDDLIRMTAKRSVFSGAELENLQAESERPLKVIDFLLTAHICPAVELCELLNCGTFRGRPPQSIAHINEEQYRKLKTKINLGFNL